MGKFDQPEDAARLEAEINKRLEKVAIEHAQRDNKAPAVAVQRNIDHVPAQRDGAE